MSIVNIIYAADVHKCIKCVNDSPGGLVELDRSNGSAGEKWTMKKQGDDVVTLQTTSGLFLHFTGNQQQLEVRREGEDRSFTLWKVLPGTVVGTVVLATQHPAGQGNVVDDSGQGTGNTNKVWGYSKNGTAAQNWVIAVTDFKN